MATAQKSAAIPLLNAQPFRRSFSVEDESVPVLADRIEFTLSPEDWKAWEALHDGPARDLPELRELMAEPSPFFVD